MPLRSDWSSEMCPVQRSLDVLGDPWVLLIVRDVLHGRGRFDALHEHLRISEAVLSRRLRTMVDAGLLERTHYRMDAKTRWGYTATPAAAELLPVLQQLAIWGEQHTAMPAGGGHMAMVHQLCGGETTQGQICSVCGEILVAQDMTWIKHWNNTRDQLKAPGSAPIA